MKLLIFLKPALDILGWVASKTKWKWDDKLVKLARKLEGVLLLHPDLCTSALNLAKYTKRTVEQEQKKFKGSDEKRKALKIIGTVVKKLPKKDVKVVVDGVRNKFGIKKK
jgi:hypothetical protein